VPIKRKPGRRRDSEFTVWRCYVGALLPHTITSLRIVLYSGGRSRLYTSQLACHYHAVTERRPPRAHLVIPATLETWSRASPGINEYAVTCFAIDALIVSPSRCANSRAKNHGVADDINGQRPGDRRTQLVGWPASWPDGVHITCRCSTRWCPRTVRLIRVACWHPGHRRTVPDRRIQAVQRSRKQAYARMHAYQR